jgi:hypothetical protein
MDSADDEGKAGETVNTNSSKYKNNAKMGKVWYTKAWQILVLITRSGSRTEMSIKTFNKTRYRISSKILVHLFTTRVHNFIDCFIGNNLTTKTLLVLRPHILHDEYVTFDENLALSSTCKLVGSYFMASLGCDGLLKRYVVKIANR